MCAQFNAPVSSQWEACSLAVSPFRPVVEPAAESKDEWASSKMVRQPAELPLSIAPEIAPEKAIAKPKVSLIDRDVDRDKSPSDDICLGRKVSTEERKKRLKN